MAMDGTHLPALFATGVVTDMTGHCAQTTLAASAIFTSALTVLDALTPPVSRTALCLPLETTTEHFQVFNVKINKYRHTKCALVRSPY